MAASPLPEWTCIPGEPSLSDVGEMEILRRIRRVLEERGHAAGAGTFLTLGPGDDAAIIQPGEGTRLVLTCDIHVEGQHFRPDLLTPEDLGHRVMVSNISDVAAMGAVPRTALVSAALPPEDPVRLLFEMLDGLSAEIEAAGGVIAGGNLSMTRGPRVVDVTLVGELEGEPFLRSGAEAGDHIVMIGSTGESAAGLWCLENAGESPGLGRSFIQPRHRLAESRRLRTAGGVKALIDTSDGLVSDLSHICEASGVAAELDIAALDPSPELMRVAGVAGRDAMEWVLGPSDDYALLAAISAESVERVLSAVGPVGRTVGRFVRGSGVSLKGDGARMPPGWDHFRGSS